VKAFSILRLRWALGLLGLAGAALSAGCGTSTQVDARAAEARAAALPSWKIEFEWAGATVQGSLERMDIFVVENENLYPEVFQIVGDDAVLVGEFPMNVHVGYGEDWKQLFGVPIAISASGGDPREPKTSWVRMNGMQIPISGGTITFDKITGKWDGSEGDKTLWGTIELRIPGADSDRTVTGRIATHAVTWG
jgi:hypothetical protein